LPPDNGLYVPAEIPILPPGFWKALPGMDFRDVAFEIARRFTGDELPESRLEAMVDEAFDFPVPLHPLDERSFVLELFHGPTLAFKDFGARFMARVMGHFLEQGDRHIAILVATSGDTGSAVAQGFLGVPGIEVVLLYPKGKVSVIQEKQLTTIGGNVRALEVAGSFDDCQRLVKTAFLDPALQGVVRLSSANSINVARWLPQSFYYFYAAGQVAAPGEEVLISVPSGNYGNLCGGLLARRMGLPARFVAASNANDVVPEYLRTGVFRPRPSVPTLSNAMDVGNPSNFPRMLELYGGDLEALRADLEGHMFTDEQTRDIIRTVFQRFNYILCPHSAVGYGGMILGKRSRAGQPSVCLSTAHPAKFSGELAEVLTVPVPMPGRLAEVLDRPKEAIAMTADFGDFRDYLMAGQVERRYLETVWTMKNLTFVFVVFALMTGFFSCDLDDLDCIRVSDQVITRDWELGDFTDVVFTGVGNVVVTQGSRHGLPGHRSRQCAGRNDDRGLRRATRHRIPQMLQRGIRPEHRNHHAGGGRTEPDRGGVY
jgi:threonine synthase